MCASQERFTVTVNVSRPCAAFSKFFHQMSYTCPKIPLQVKFFRWRHFEFPSMSLIFLRKENLLSVSTTTDIIYAQMTRTSLEQKYMYCTILASISTNECITLTFWPGLNRTLALGWGQTKVLPEIFPVRLISQSTLPAIKGTVSRDGYVFKIIEQITVCDI